MSLDGYLDDASNTRLLLSGPEDLDRVDALRASCDAVLVGANTVRQDDPRLVVRTARRRADRVRRGLSATPTRVVVTSSGELPGNARCVTDESAQTLVYAPETVTEALRERFSGPATVLSAGSRVELPWLLDDLGARGVRRLLVEGGSAVLTGFLTAGLVDELRVAIAGFFVGDVEAPRFVGAGRFPYTAESRLRLDGVEQVGEMAVLRFRNAGNAALGPGYPHVGGGASGVADE